MDENFTNVGTKINHIQHEITEISKNCFKDIPTKISPATTTDPDKPPYFIKSRHQLSRKFSHQDKYYDPSTTNSSPVQNYQIINVI